MTLDTEITRKGRKLREAKQRREEMEERLVREFLWLSGAWLACPFIAAYCYEKNENVGKFFLYLFFFLTLVLFLHRFAIQPIRRARFEWSEIRRRRQEETREQQEGRERKQTSRRATVVGDTVLWMLAGLFCILVFLFVGYGFWCAVDGGRPNPAIGQTLLISIAVCALLFGAYAFVIAPVLNLFSAPSRRWKRKKEASTVAPETSGDFTELLAAILVATAKADGRVTRAELTVILNFFKKQADYDAARVKRLIKRALDQPKDFNSLLETLANGFSYPAHVTTVELIFQLVHTKNPPLAAELDFAHDIAAALDIRWADLYNIEAKCRDRANAEADARERREEAARKRQAESSRERREREQREREERLRRERAERQQREREERARREQEEARRRQERERRARFSAKDEQAFALLGLEPGATFAAIKKNYRKLVAQYHPDKVGHLGEEYRRIATEKTKELNAAYRYLEERFGK